MKPYLSSAKMMQLCVKSEGEGNCPGTSFTPLSENIGRSLLNPTFAVEKLAD